MSEPTLGEVVRRLDQIAAQQRDMLQEMRDDRQNMARTYMPRELYEARHASLRADLEARDAEMRSDIDELRKDRRDDEKHRRQQWSAIALIFLTALVSMVATMLQGGGVT